MGVDTKVKLVGFVPPSEIIRVLEKNLGLTVADNTRIETQEFSSKDVVYLGQKGVIKTVIGYLAFEYKGEIRSMFYLHQDAVFMNNETNKNYVKEGLPELIGEVTDLSLGCNDNAIEILTEVAREFNGYIDENDCDDDYYHKVDKK